MSVGEETAGVRDDLLNMEASSIISSLRVIGTDKEWTLQAAV